MFVVTAELKVKKGHTQDVEKLLLSIFPKVQEEEGTTIYTMQSKTDQPESILFYEQYSSKEAFDAHLSTPYLQDVLAKSAEFLMEEPVLTMYNEISSIIKKGE